KDGSKGQTPNIQRGIPASRIQNSSIAYLVGAGEVTSFWKRGSPATAGKLWSGRSTLFRSGDLTYSHTIDMVFHMKTTLNIDDTVMSRLRREAARQGKTISELVAAALRLLLHDRIQKRKKKLPPL